jgi:hypothetical protein
MGVLEVRFVAAFNEAGIATPTELEVLVDGQALENAALAIVMAGSVVGVITAGDKSPDTSLALARQAAGFAADTHTACLSALLRAASAPQA